MAAFTNPPNFAAQPSNDALWNTYLKENMEHLKAPPTSLYAAGSGSTSFTTSWAAMGSFTVTLTTYGGDVLIILSGVEFNNITGIAYLDIDIDGIRKGASDGILASTTDDKVLLVWLEQGLLEGSHIITLYGKASTSGSLTANNGQFYAREIS
jgi:hypothetical protein